MNLADLASDGGTMWSQVALVLGMLVFLGVAVYVFVIRRAPAFEHQRHLPFADTAPLATGSEGEER